MNNTELFMISRGKSIFTGIPGRVSRRTILYLERPLSPARIQIKAIPLVAHGRSKAKQKINTPRANTQNKHSEFTNPRKTWSKTTGDAIHQPKILGVTFRRWTFSHPWKSSEIRLKSPRFVSFIVGCGCHHAWRAPGTTWHPQAGWMLLPGNFKLDGWIGSFFTTTETLINMKTLIINPIRLIRLDGLIRLITIQKSLKFININMIHEHSQSNIFTNTWKFDNHCQITTQSWGIW